MNKKHALFFLIVLVFLSIYFFSSRFWFTEHQGNTVKINKYTGKTEVLININEDPKFPWEEKHYKWIIAE